MEDDFMPIRLMVNGVMHRLFVEPRRLLADVLREDLGLTGTNLGCEHGVCGSCTVLITPLSPPHAGGPGGVSQAVEQGGIPRAGGQGGIPQAGEPRWVSVRSCLMFAVQADGYEIMTVEGLARNGEMHPLQKAFWEQQALQCGFCTPGFLMTAYELLQHDPNPSEEAIRRALSGNICRCTGYQHIVAAVQAAAEAMTPAQGIILEQARTAG
jgi:aerobic-type carbon monoxide dehydrogenase small subunit (CoxS/CutS family)